MREDNNDWIRITIAVKKNTAKNLYQIKEEKDLSFEELMEYFIRSMARFERKEYEYIKSGSKR